MIQLLIINTLCWLFLHFSISLGLLRAPESIWTSDSLFDVLFREKSFEKKGKFWKKYLLVHQWKDRLPDGASVFNLGYKKKVLPNKSLEEVQRFIKETKRAELTHWFLMLPAPLFFFWNPIWAAWLNVFYALIANSPFIVIQRYNRSRLSSIKLLMKNKSRK